MRVRTSCLISIPYVVLEVVLVSVVGCQVVFVKRVTFYFGSHVPEDDVIVLFESNSCIISEMSFRTIVQSWCRFVKMMEFSNIVFGSLWVSDWAWFLTFCFSSQSLFSSNLSSGRMYICSSSIIPDDCICILTSIAFVWICFCMLISSFSTRFTSVLDRRTAAVFIEPATWAMTKLYCKT